MRAGHGPENMIALLFSRKMREQIMNVRLVLAAALGALSFVAAQGAVLGELLFLLMKSRRRTGLRNLQLCFREWTDAERRRVLRRHFRELAGAFLGYGILMHGLAKRVERLVRREGLAHFDAAAAQGEASLYADPAG